MNKTIIARGNNTYTKRWSLKDIIEIKDKIIINNNNSIEYTKEEKIDYLGVTLANQPNSFIELIYIESLDIYLCTKNEQSESVKALFDFLDNKIKFVYENYNGYDCKNKTFSEIDETLRNRMLDMIEIDFNIKPLELNLLKYEDITKNLIEIEYKNYCEN